MDRLFKLRRLAYRFAIWFVNAFGMNLPSNALRLVLLRLLGGRIGAGTRISRGVKVDFPWRLRIGNNSTINTGVYLDCRGTGVSIGNCVNVSSDAILYTLTHDIYSLDFAARRGEVALADGVWVCARAIILPGTFIGTGSVVGANSVVKGNIPDHQLWQGNPATFQKTLPAGRGLDYKP